MCPAVDLRAAGVTVALGTDNVAANNSYDMIAEMRVAGLVASHREGVAQPISSAELIRMTTIEGAKALGLEHEIGSLEVGKKADFVLHDTDRPEWRPLFNVVNQLVWSADGRSVHSVWVDGVRVVDNYRATLVDEEELLARAQVAGEAIVKRSGLQLRQPWPVV